MCRWNCRSSCVTGASVSTWNSSTASRPTPDRSWNFSGHIDLTSLDIRDRQNERLFFLPLMQVDIAPTRPLAKDIHLSALHVYNLEVSLES